MSARILQFRLRGDVTVGEPAEPRCLGDQRMYERHEPEWLAGYFQGRADERREPTDVVVEAREVVGRLEMAVSLGDLTRLTALVCVLRSILGGAR